MNKTYQDIFRAIHEEKWLSIEYKNKAEKITKYWIGIEGIDVENGKMPVKGLHLGTGNIEEYELLMDSIQSAQIVEGTYFPSNKELIRDIYEEPIKYQKIFHNIPNLRILNYLEDCNRMNVSPWQEDFTLLKNFDETKIEKDEVILSKEQFNDLMKFFKQKLSKEEEVSQKIQTQQLALNVLSIHTPKGLHVLAYRALNLDIENRCLRKAKEITVCKEFTIGGTSESIRRYLDAENYRLINNFEQNQEKIKDCITLAIPQYCQVDDNPYIINIKAEYLLNLRKEYAAIMEMHQQKKVTAPIRAFFGELQENQPIETVYSLALLDKKINIDQMLAIHNVMKSPATYVQGPPGTGKTSTIINTITTAFFHGKTILGTSYNNHPIDEVFKKLSSMKYKGEKRIPFPVVRLGNKKKMQESIKHIRKLCEQASSAEIYEKKLERIREKRNEEARELNSLLEKYGRLMDLRNRLDILKKMCSENPSGILPLLQSRVKQQMEEIGRAHV